MNLPEEIIVEILIRSRSRSLLRFSCVCKSWYSLINSPKFRKLQINHSHAAQKYGVLFSRCFDAIDNKELYTLHDESEKLEEIVRYDPPYQTMFHKPAILLHESTVLGSINGLICLQHGEDATLWNPSINKCLTLPPPASFNTQRTYLRLSETRYFGFAFDASADDYKVLCITSVLGREIDSYYGGLVDRVVDVFSLATKSWRTIDVSAPSDSLDGDLVSIGLDFYVLAKIKDHTDHYKVVSFDLQSELFTEIKCPDDFVSVPYCLQELTVLRNSVALINQVCSNQYHIWVMRDDGESKSWTKIYSIELTGWIGIGGFGRNGQLVLVGTGQWEVLPLVETPTIMNFVSSDPILRWNIESYMESLLLREPLPNTASDEKKRRSKRKRRAYIIEA